jgi:hypothetical protein
LFQDFVSTYQICSKPSVENLKLESRPFVYVNSDGEIKLITDVVDSIGGKDEIFALSIAQDGYMEFLAFQD